MQVTCAPIVMLDEFVTMFEFFLSTVEIVGRIGEKMFTSGRKCDFFHKIAQYYANAGNPEDEARKDNSDSELAMKCSVRCCIFIHCVSVHS